MGLLSSGDGGRDIAVLGRVGSRDARDAVTGEAAPVDEEEENRIMREDD